MARSTRNGMTPGKKAAIIFTTILFTAFAAILVINLAMGDKEIDKRIESLYKIDDPQFTRTMGSMLGPAILAGNRTETLVNGDQIFPAMLKAISGARRTITFETYIYWSGRIGRAFADALIERARAGVKVHVLLDWVGSGKIDDKLIKEMETAGIEIQRYNPPRWYTFGRLNNRTHRKLLVVDGSVGFTGGVGIADQWTGNAQDPNHWRETHYRIEGPVVAQMQAAFHDNWVEVTGTVLHGEIYFPALKPAGTQYGQVFTSSPRGGGDSMHLMYLLSIASAAKSIRLSASYFVPDDVAVEMMVAAVRRGVKIQIILPGPLVDTAVVRRASRSTWGPLLRAGVEIYEYQPTMFHCKVMVVDDVWTSVGSTNFDNRSFAVNDEANLNVYDREFARVQIRLFEEDLKRSRRITLEEWENRPWTMKLWEHTLGAFSSQL
jgi:cardiolipin synthase